MTRTLLDERKTTMNRKNDRQHSANCDEGPEAASVIIEDDGFCEPALRYRRGQERLDYSDALRELKLRREETQLCRELSGRKIRLLGNKEGETATLVATRVRGLCQ